MHKKTSLYLIILTLISAGVYFNSLYNKFAFDDVHIIENNPLIKDPKNFFLLFRSEYGARTDFAGVKIYRPRVMATYLVTAALSGKSPFWHHSVNVVLNAFAVLIVFFLGRNLFASFYGKEGFETASFFCALIFAVHPVHAEAVAGIAGRSEIMAGIFCFLAFIFYAKKKFFLSFAAFFLAFLSKENDAALLSPDDGNVFYEAEALIEKYKKMNPSDPKIGRLEAAIL